MLKVYMDKGSKDEAHGIMCVSGAVFEPERFKVFSRLWNRMLDRVGIGHFHAADFYGRYGYCKGIPKDKHDFACRRIPQLINEHTSCVLTVSFRQQEFDTVAPPEWKKRFGSTHGVATQMVVGAFGHWANEHEYSGPVAYVIESGDDDEYGVEKAFKAIRTTPVLNSHSRYQSHSFVEKGTTRGIEVADCFAWHWNKFYAESYFQRMRPIRADLKSMVVAHPNKYRVYNFDNAKLRRFLKRVWYQDLPPDDARRLAADL
jgi:hypothetical protein